MDAVEVGLRYTARIRVSDTYAYNVGVDYERWGFSKAPGLAVPNTLQGVSLVLGNRWRFADKWTVSITLPRPNVTYAFDDKLAVFVGGELTGGAYAVGDKFGTRLGDPTLDGERLTYREIRAGAGVRYDVSKKLRLELEGGWVIDRRFIYNDRDLQFNGDGAPYVRIGLSGSY